MLSITLTYILWMVKITYARDYQFVICNLKQNNRPSRRERNRGPSLAAHMLQDSVCTRYIHTSVSTYTP